LKGSKRVENFSKNALERILKKISFLFGYDKLLNVLRSGVFAYVGKALYLTLEFGIIDRRKWRDSP
jgi:hypothetical protein